MLAGFVGSNPAEGMDVCVLWGSCFVRGLSVALITCPEESYRVWCVCECDYEASIIRKPWPTDWVGAIAPWGKRKDLGEFWWCELCFVLPLFYSFCNFILGPINEIGTVRWVEIIGNFWSKYKFLFLIFLGKQNIYHRSHFRIVTLIPKFVDILMNEEYTYI